MAYSRDDFPADFLPTSCRRLPNFRRPTVNLTFRPLDIQPSLLPQGIGGGGKGEIGNFHLHLPFLDEQKREFRGKREEKKVGGGALIATSPDQGTKERRDSPRV